MHAVGVVEVWLLRVESRGGRTAVHRRPHYTACGGARCSHPFHDSHLGKRALSVSGFNKKIQLGTKSTGADHRERKKKGLLLFRRCSCPRSVPPPPWTPCPHAPLSTIRRALVTSVPPRPIPYHPIPSHPIPHRLTVRARGQNS